jgi:hypothetical protein
MSDEARRRLAQQQSELVHALGGASTVPVGFDRLRLSALAQSLAHKRADAVGRIWPEVPAALGAAAYRQAFDAYAAACPLPAEGGATADGRAFIAWYGSRHRLPDELRWRALVTDLAFVRRGLRRRRGFAVRMAWLPGARRLALGLRLPWLGVICGSLPLTFGRKTSKSGASPCEG